MFNKPIKTLLVLLLLLETLGLTQDIYPPRQTLLTKLKTKPKGPENAFKSCFQDKCQCKRDRTHCYLSDKYGAVTLDITSRKDQDKVTLSCEGESKALDTLLSQVLPKFQYEDTYFKIINCQQIPAMLRRENITYEGVIVYNDADIMLPKDLFHGTTGLLRLTFNITSAYGGTILTPQLFHTLTALTELELIIVSDATAVTLPEMIFRKLKALQKLSLYVYHTSVGYYETMNALRTSAQNLTSAHFRDLNALNCLLLDANRLRKLDATIFTTLHQLNYLGLSLNELVELPERLLANQRKLVILDLSANALSALPVGFFANTPLLWKLLLNDNRFYVPTNIIAAIQALHFLHQLDLSRNQLRNVWGTGVYRNRTLLTRSNIKQPHEEPALIEYVSVEQGAYNERHINHTVISLRQNHITRFNLDWLSGADGIACPYEIDLAANNIQTVYAVRQPASATGKCVRWLRLFSNPLHCDCKLAWIYNSDFLSQNTDWSCATPAPLADKSLKELQRAELCPWQPGFCPERCKCAYEMKELVVNCTSARLAGITQLPRPQQFGRESTVLYVAHNNFYELPANTTSGYAQVTHIYAAHNRLITLLPTHLPPNLTVLDVRHNLLERLSTDFLRVYLNESATLRELYLAENPWFCDCDAVEFLRVLRLQRALIPDAAQLVCVNFPALSLLNVTYAEICKSPFLAARLIAPLIVLFISSALVLTLLALFYKYKLSVKIWFFGRNWCLCCVNELELDKNKTFDAFISYAHQDQHFVNDVLLPGLEEGPTRFRICTHERNWLAGVYIPEQIIESVEQSCRTIIVLSQHFIESDWARLEFRTAHQCALNEGRVRIIIIKYGELTDKTRLDEELLAYLKLNTYLDSNDPRFWTKLRYALPHKFGELRKSGMLDVSRRAYVNEMLELDVLPEQS
ncbi:protein toll-like [Ceratitis capitata]|uniref:protein toll-like n=1 Tax=Ceratitis capitata TaxID=7213 RepID=UPI00032984A0|nr:protein toll-like [Ceratitis capitata]